MEKSIRLWRLASGAALLRAIVAPVQAFGRRMVDLGERSPVMVALGRLSQTSDADLRARGVTREDEIRRILGPRAAF